MSSSLTIAGDRTETLHPAGTEHLAGTVDLAHLAHLVREQPAAIGAT